MAEHQCHNPQQVSGQRIQMAPQVLFVFFFRAERQLRGEEIEKHNILNSIRSRQTLQLTKFRQNSMSNPVAAKAADHMFRCSHGCKFLEVGKAECSVRPFWPRPDSLLLTKKVWGRWFWFGIGLNSEQNPGSASSVANARIIPELNYFDAVLIAGYLADLYDINENISRDTDEKGVPGMGRTQMNPYLTIYDQIGSRVVASFSVEFPDRGNKIDEHFVYFTPAGAALLRERHEQFNRLLPMGVLLERIAAIQDAAAAAP
jgi:hypothetical protein